MGLLHQLWNDLNNNYKFVKQQSFRNMTRTDTSAHQHYTKVVKHLICV
jgi:hypothetical protein